MTDAVIATGNRHKFKELKELLAVPGIRWRSLAEFPQFKPIRESGRAFEANAIKKAQAVSLHAGMPALADDSGIEVDALKGEPGIRSARFAGRHGDDEANNVKMLRLLRDAPQVLRVARYRCVLALCNGRQVLSVAQGEWEGQIAREPAGSRGFGYDPIFYLPRRRKTAGQISRALKQRLSHRAAAARRMRPALRRLSKERIHDPLQQIA
jgi:XTP/dITP diphosphohydrolase